jgi:hypothetical protein
MGVLIVVDCRPLVVASMGVLVVGLLVVGLVVVGRRLGLVVALLGETGMARHGYQVTV